jgi:NADH dehydrogenase
MEEKTRIVILGGGYGGVHTAKNLYKKFKKKKNIEIVLIDKNPYHTLMTELHEVAGSRVDPSLVQVSFDRIFGGKRITVYTDTIKSIDFDQKVLKSKVAEYQYDYLVIGAGGDPEFFGIPGVQENSFTLWSLEDAMRIREHVENRFREAAREPDDQERKKMLTFAVAGAGFTGIELAGELLERKKTLCREYHIDESEVSVLIIEALDSILPIMPVKLRKKSEKRLKKMGAEILINSPIVEAEPGKIKISDGKEIATDTFIWTCGIHGSEFTANVDLTKGQCARGESTIASIEGIHGMAGCRFDEDERYIVGERGRILVNEHMQSVDYENVYLVGDIIWYVKEEKVIPQIVETALQTAETAAHNIAAEIDKKEKTAFDPNYHGFMVSIGGKYAVSNAGGMKLSGFFAMALKHLINLHYLLGLGGINVVWSYLQHEFFTMKEGRSIAGNHLSAKIPIYWAVPLRIYVGVLWLIEGINKIRDGWLNPDNIYIIAESVSSATPGEGGGEWEAADALLSEPWVVYQWIADNILTIAPSFFQIVVVLAEIAVGLALIGGLFTFLAAAASIALSLMFIVSAMTGPEIFWYIFAAIVFLGGAGRGFGLDHWVMPWLKKHWNGTGLAKRTYLYTNEPRKSKVRKFKR